MADGAGAHLLAVDEGASFRREAASPGRRIGWQVGELAAGELRTLGMNSA